ncbi:MAG: RsmE family RNA methyltransferase [Candidatus Aminicenantales bacterium]
MTSNQFFVPRMERGSTRVVLEGSEHHHLAKAARIKEGDTVRLFDAARNRCLAQVESVEKARTTLKVLEEAPPEALRVKLVLAQAMLQAKKMEFILQKASEIGITGFIPVETARSLKASGNRSGSKAERWAKIAREATKQSKGGAAPAIYPAERLKVILARPAQGLRIFLSENGGQLLRCLLMEAGSGGPPPAPEVTVFVGPEGGWTGSEEKGFREAGCEAVSLGSRILKAETAAIAGVAMMAHFWNG